MRLKPEQTSNCCDVLQTEQIRLLEYLATMGNFSLHVYPQASLFVLQLLASLQLVAEVLRAGVKVAVHEEQVLGLVGPGALLRPSKVQCCKSRRTCVINQRTLRKKRARDSCGPFYLL